MERVGHIWRVRPGKLEEYARRHAEIWPELDALLREAGVTRYTIYSWGEFLFSHLECDDFALLAARFNGDPVAQRWEQEMSDVLEYLEVDPETGWPARLREIWSLR